MIPQKFVNIFMEYWRQDSKKAEPVISCRTAAGLSLLLTLLYVLPLYASAKTRPSPTLARDAPSVIQARVRAVTVSVAVSGFITVCVAWTKGHLAPVDILEVFGLWPILPLDILKSLALVALLFLGPLFESGIVEGGWERWVKGTDVSSTLMSSVGWRNYVVAPISEELVFRSFIVALHMFAWVSVQHLIFLTPLYFGVAHVHHFYEFTLQHPKVPLLPALIRSLVQFTYTSVFGFYASFIFLRTGSLPAAILTHAFCNWMGLPRFWGRLQAPTAMGPSTWTMRKADRADDNQESTSVPTPIAAAMDYHILGLGWTVAYYCFLVTGAVGFCFCLWPLTKSTNSLVEFYAKMP